MPISTVWRTKFAESSDGLTLDTHALNDLITDLVSEPGPSLELDGTIGSFKVGCCIGTGAQGRVFEAYDEELDRRVAIKVTKVESEEHRLRFVREAKLLSQIHHEAVCTAYQFDARHDPPILVMEFIDGISLGDTIASSANRPVDEGATRAVAEAFEILARGLAEAHRNGLLHRDISPDNIMMRASGTPVLIDFGVAVDESDVKDTWGETSVHGARAVHRSSFLRRPKNGHLWTGRVSLRSPGVPTSD